MIMLVLNKIKGMGGATFKNSRNFFVCGPLGSTNPNMTAAVSMSTDFLLFLSQQNKNAYYTNNKYKEEKGGSGSNTLYRSVNSC